MIGKGRWPFLLAGVVAVLITASAYLFFELGRYQAGYSILDRQRQVDAFERAAADDEAEIEELKRRLAIAETSRDIDRETYARVETSLTELEAKLQAQEEELAFYRGIISPDDGVSGLKIQSLEVESTNSEQRYVIRLVLMQAIVHNRPVRGVVRLSVTGTRDGADMDLPLEELTADDNEITEIEYGFRYFQGLEQSVELPAGFEPRTVEVEVWPTEPRGDPLTRSFRWDAVGGDTFGE